MIAVRAEYIRNRMSPYISCDLMQNDASRWSMPYSSRRNPKRAPAHRRKTGPAGSGAEMRYSVGLPTATAKQVEQYAQLVDSSMSKAIAALVRIGLESQEARRREFFGKLRKNLANDDPAREQELVDEFRTLILGR